MSRQFERQLRDLTDPKQLKQKKVEIAGQYAVQLRTTDICGYDILIDPKNYPEVLTKKLQRWNQHDIYPVWRWEHFTPLLYTYLPKLTADAAQQFVADLQRNTSGLHPNWLPLLISRTLQNSLPTEKNCRAAGPYEDKIMPLSQEGFNGWGLLVDQKFPEKAEAKLRELKEKLVSTDEHYQERMQLIIQGIFATESPIDATYCAMFEYYDHQGGTILHHIASLISADNLDRLDPLTAWLDNLNEPDFTRLLTHTNKKEQNCFQVAAQQQRLQTLLNLFAKITKITPDWINHRLAIPDNAGLTAWHHYIQSHATDQLILRETTLHPSIQALQVSTGQGLNFLEFTALTGSPAKLAMIIEQLRHTNLLDAQATEQSLALAIQSGDGANVKQLLALELRHERPPAINPDSDAAAGAADGDSTPIITRPAQAQLTKLVASFQLFRCILIHGNLQILNSVTEQMSSQHWLQAGQRKTLQSLFTLNKKPTLKRHARDRIINNPYAACGRVIEYIYSKTGVVRQRLLSSFSSLLEHYHKPTAPALHQPTPDTDRTFNTLLNQVNTNIRQLTSEQRADLNNTVLEELGNRLKAKEGNESWRSLPVARFASTRGNRGRSFATVVLGARVSDGGGGAAATTPTH
jgi:hypothetical protein